MIGADLRQRLKATPALPSLPAAAMQILELAQSQEADPSALVAAIEKDPALSVRVLRACNSPALRRSREIRSVREAQLVLGYEATLTLGLSFCLFTTMRRVQARRIDYEQFWRRCVCVSEVSALLAAERGKPSADARLAGLLHDMGTLVLDAALPEDARAGLDDEGRCLSGEVGAWVIERWKLPECLASVCYACSDLEHNPERVPEDHRALVDLVGMACRIVSIWFESEGDAGSRIERARELIRSTWGWSDEGLFDLLEGADEAMQTQLEALELGRLDEQMMIGVMDEAREILLFNSVQQHISAQEANSRAEVHRERARRMEEASLRDELTGLWNRRKLFTSLELMLEEAAREQRALTVAFADLDHFKPINDTYGHGAGDQVLKSFADRLQHIVRSDDLVARYGGEEFTLVMPDLDLASAESVLSRVLKQLGVMRYRIDAGDEQRDIPVTASFGMRCITPEEAPRMDARRVLSEADAALYHAKESGRGRLAAFRDGKLETVAVVEEGGATGVIARLTAMFGRRRGD